MLAAVELALEDGVPARAHILNVLHRLTDGKPASAPPVDTPQGLVLSQGAKLSIGTQKCPLIGTQKGPRLMCVAPALVCAPQP